MLLVAAPVTAQETEEFEESEEDAAAARESGERSLLEGPDRRSIEGMRREELEEEGFIFEDTLTEQERAYATIFAFLPGSIVRGVGHWHLGDSRTGLFLLGMEGVAFALLGTGAALALNPSPYPVLNERRQEMWHLGVGLLGMSWLIDMFGTAYRDDLGIPPSTRRIRGWGVALNYEYWRPDGLALRHVSSANVAGKSRHFQVEANTAQELGYGMSDYQLTGRWFPFVGQSPETRVGVELSGRYMQYRLDDPFERTDVTAVAQMSLNLGRLFAHLDQMTAGFELGFGVRGYRLLDELEEWNPLSYGGYYIPMRMSLDLNLTDELRLGVAFERWQGGWLERSRNRVGVPVIDFSYRSTERLDLNFFAAFGNGIGLGGGLRMWFGE